MAFTFDAMWIYYRDVTLYGIAITLFVGMMTGAIHTSFIAILVQTFFFFGILGSVLGVIAFQYFQKHQYYMYYNLGFTKRFLILKTVLLNLIIGCFLGLLFSLLL